MKLNYTQLREIMELAQAIAEIGDLPCGCKPCYGACYSKEDLRETAATMSGLAREILGFMPIGEDAVG